MTPKRQQMNVRLDPELIAAADADRATLSLSRDRYVEAVLTAHLYGPPTQPEPDPAAALAEAAQLAARISGNGSHHP